MQLTKCFCAFIHLSCMANKKLITKGLSHIPSYTLNYFKEYSIHLIFKYIISSEILE